MAMTLTFTVSPHLQDYVGSLDALVGNLGYVNQAGKSVAQVDECAVGLDALYLSFRHEAHLYIGDLRAAFLCGLLS